MKLITANVLLVLLADWLFYDHPFGWSAAVFTAGVLLVLSLRRGDAVRSVGGVVLLAAMLGLAASLAVAPGPLNLTMTLVGLGFLAMTDRGGWASSLGVWGRRWLRFVPDLGLRWLLDHHVLGRWLRRNPGARPAVFRVAVGWVLPLGLTSLFVWLFSQANPIIFDWLSAAGRWVADVLDYFPDFVTPGRLVFWLAFAAGTWALLRTRAGRHRRESASRPAPPPLPDDPWQPRVRRLVVRSLVLFNLVFAVQTALDARYLVLGARLPAGVTYARYAHQGAYPLLAAAVFAGVFVLVTFREGSLTEADPAARRLVFVWIGQNVLMTLGAIVRLAAYVSAYSLTRFRVAAAIWMALVAVGLVWVLWRLLSRRDNAWLLRVNLLTAVAVLYACCFMNFDRFIADYNVRHCRDVGAPAVSLDVGYLVSLGPDALPALVAVRDRIPDEPRRAELLRGIASLHADLRSSLSDWRGWTLARGRLVASLPPGLPSGKYENADAPDVRSARRDRR